MNHTATQLKLFCPRRDCPCYQSLDNNITKDGIYTTKNDGAVRQMFNCGKGKHRFSETGYCDLFGKHGSFKEYEQMCKLSLSLIHISEPTRRTPISYAVF